MWKIIGKQTAPAALRACPPVLANLTSSKWGNTIMDCLPLSSLLLLSIVLKMKLIWIIWISELSCDIDVKQIKCVFL